MDYKLQRLHLISQQVKCPTCHGQTLDSSEVLTAVALKEDITGQIVKGKTDAEIIDTLVHHHGTEILRNPSFDTETYALWGVPLLLIVCAIGFFVMRLRGRR